jgi:hypothetical protein
MADAKKLLVEKARELVALATSRSVRLPSGADGLGKAANALNTTKNGAEFDLVRASYAEPRVRVWFHELMLACIPGCGAEVSREAVWR